MSRGSVAYFYFFGDRFIRFAISFSILSIWYFGPLSIMTQYTHNLPFLPSVRHGPSVSQSVSQSVGQSVKILAFRLIFLKFEVLGIVMFYFQLVCFLLFLN